MKLSVYFTPLGLTHSEVASRLVLVVDVLRFTTTVVTALGSGARAVLPAATASDALQLAQKLARDDVLLAGEQGYRRIDGFALGNSPSEMTPDAVDGKTLVMTTTNGTTALLAADPGRPVVVGAAVNFSAAVEATRKAFEKSKELIILCAGRERQFALEDAYVAGRFAREVLPSPRPRSVELNDAAIAAEGLVRRYGDRWKRAVTAGEASRRLKELGFAADLNAATAVDTHGIVPYYAERQITI